VQILGLTSRIVQNRYLFQCIKSAESPGEVMELISDWEKIQ